MTERALSSFLKRVGPAFLGWTFVGLFFGMRLFFAYHVSANPISWRQAFAWSFLDAYLWAALSPIIFYAARRFGLGPTARVRNFAIHLGLGFLLASVHSALYGAALWFFPLPGEEVTLRSLVQGLAFGKYHLGVVTYWLLVFIRHALDYRRRMREEELRVSRIETQLARAQLQALKMQLHPHFLFNTLNAISALMHRDVDAADRMLVRLSDLLRLTLESGGLQEVPLKQELEFLARYLEIEQTRFADRLRIHMDIDSDVLDARVPNLILQPLVENAIRHGIGASSAAGEIEIAAHRENGTLFLEVRDDGPGLPSPGPIREGVGISNTRRRLVQLYGPAHEFELSNGKNGGLRVSLRLPFQREAVLDEGEDSHG